MARVKRKRSPLDWKVLVEDDQDLLRSLMREALQEVLEAEMDEALQAGNGQRTPQRMGYRSGYYSRTLEALRVGDSLRREVSRTIESSVGMLLPPLSFEADEGIAVYTNRPRVSDERSRGQMRGTREDAATYVLEQEGAYELPEIVIAWWDLRTSQLRREVLPKVELVVAANPDLATEHLGGAEFAEEPAPGAEPTEPELRTTWRSIAALAVGLLTLFFLARRSKGLAVRLAEKWRQRSESEAAAFRSFRKASHRGEPLSTYRALLAWLDRAEPETLTPTLREFLDQAGDPELAEEVDRLEKHLFGSAARGPSSWSGKALLRAVSRCRRRALRSRSGRSEHACGLPPLNPIS